MFWVSVLYYFYYDYSISFLGGNDGTGPISNVECYKKNEWEILPSLPHGLEGAAAVCVDKRIYVTGGFNQNIGISNKVWVCILGYYLFNYCKI